MGGFLHFRLGCRQLNRQLLLGSLCVFGRCLGRLGGSLGPLGAGPGTLGAGPALLGSSLCSFGGSLGPFAAGLGLVARLDGLIEPGRAFPGGLLGTVAHRMAHIGFVNFAFCQGPAHKIGKLHLTRPLAAGVGLGNGPYFQALFVGERYRVHQAVGPAHRKAQAARAVFFLKGGRVKADGPHLIFALPAAADHLPQNGRPGGGQIGCLCHGFSFLCCIF